MQELSDMSSRQEVTKQQCRTHLHFNPTFDTTGVCVCVFVQVMSNDDHCLLDFIT